MRSVAESDVSSESDDDVPAAAPAPARAQTNPSARRALIPPPARPKPRLQQQCADISDDSDTEQPVVHPRVKLRPKRRGPVGPNNLIAVHHRYNQVLDYIRDQSCSIREACYQTSVPVQTLRDTQGIAELKVVDQDQYHNVLAECINQRVLQGSKPRTVKQIETRCRDALNSLKDRVVRLRQDGKLIPFSRLF